MNDAIRESFLLAQEREARELAGESDILSIAPRGPRPHERYELGFDARSVLATRTGPRESRGLFVVSVWFPSDYQCKVVIPRVLTWRGPANVFHPNVRGPFICPGTIRPATPLVELCYRLYWIITYQNFGLHNPLNPAAAAWARRNLARFPIDSRPLKRRGAGFEIQVFERDGVA